MWDTETYAATTINTILFILLYIFILFATRCAYLLFRLSNQRAKFKGRQWIKTMIVIGSGGHTREMLKIVEQLNCRRFSPRIYIMANTDTNSFTKITAVEEALRRKLKTGGENEGMEKAAVRDASADPEEEAYKICYIPRSREVHQGYATSMVSTLIATVYAMGVVAKHRPELILCNGPGTCVPICIAGFLARVLYLSNSSIIFVESFCRVKTYSLTGKILKYLADMVIVQWPELLSQSGSHFSRMVYLNDDEDNKDTKPS